MSVTEMSELLERVDAALESVRPHLKGDGVNVEVVGVTDIIIILIKLNASTSPNHCQAQQLYASCLNEIRHDFDFTKHFE